MGPGRARRHLRLRAWLRIPVRRPRRCRAGDGRRRLDPSHLRLAAGVPRHGVDRDRLVGSGATGRRPGVGPRPVVGGTNPHRIARRRDIGEGAGLRKGCIGFSDDGQGMAKRVVPRRWRCDQLQPAPAGRTPGAGNVDGSPGRSPHTGAAGGGGRRRRYGTAGHQRRRRAAYRPDP